MASINQVTIKHRKGQGILETIVAFSVLITGIVALMSMVISGSIGRQANEKQTIATNLAREGVEVVVSKRNDNWINGLPFDTGLYFGTDYTVNASLDPATGMWDLNNFANVITSSYSRMYKYVSGTYTGLFVQGTKNPPDDSIVSEYNRLLSLDPICYDGTTETIVTSGSSCSGTPGKIGMRVTSLVQWTDKNDTHTTSVVENLYDWR